MVEAPHHNHNQDLPEAKDPTMREARVDFRVLQAALAQLVTVVLQMRPEHPAAPSHRQFRQVFPVVNNKALAHAVSHKTIQPR